MLKVTINDKIVTMLLDTGAHISVIPRSLIPDSVELDVEGHTGRAVRALADRKFS